jgi:hypothetical protein
MSNKTILAVQTLTLSVLALLLPAQVVLADNLYTNEGAFDSATTNLTTINFTASCSTCFTDYTSYTDTGTGTVFSIVTPFVNLTGADYYGPGVYPADFLVQSSTASAVANVLTVTPPSGFSAIGFMLGSLGGSSFVATLSDGAMFTITPPAFNGLSFFGFTSAGPITSFNLSIPAGDSFIIDQTVLADVAPEPATGALVAAALGIAALLRRRRAPRLG